MQTEICKINLHIHNVYVANRSVDPANRLAKGPRVESRRVATHFIDMKHKTEEASSRSESGRGIPRDRGVVSERHQHPPPQQ